MPVTCIVVGCGHRGNRDKVSFYCVPDVVNSKYFPHLNDLSRKRRQKWIAAIKRDDLTPSILRNQRVCGIHFISGKPSKLEDVDNPDWAPSQHMGHVSQATSKRKRYVARKVRVGKRRKLLADRRENESQIHPEENMTSCSVPSCNNYRYSTGVSRNDISYHRFPRNEEVREKWLKAIQPIKPITENRYVCSVHFLEDDFERNLRAELLDLPKIRKLKPTAVPSLYLDKSEKAIFEETINEISPFVTFEYCDDETGSENDQNTELKPDIQRIDTSEHQNDELLTTSKNIPFLNFAVDSEDNETLIDIDSKSITFDTRSNFASSPEIPENMSEISQEMIEISQDGDEQKSVLMEKGNVRCRTCLEDIRTCFFVTSEAHATMTIKEMLLFCIPQMALSDDDVICNKCLTAIQFCVKFIENCLEVEKTFHPVNRTEMVNQYDDKDSCDSNDNIKIDHDYAIKSDCEKKDNYQNLESNVSESLRANKCKRTYLNIDEQSEDTPQKVFKCLTCDRIFKSQRYLKTHIGRMHIKKSNDEKQENLTSSNAAEKTGLQVEEFLQGRDQERFNCPYCEKSFKTENYLLLHLRRVHELFERSEEGKVEVAKLIENTGKRYICKICHYSFPRQASYNRHLKKHTEENPEIFCRVCGLTFSNKQEVVEHRRSHGIICSVCFKGFSTREEIDAHRETHPNIFFCKECGKGFKMKKSLVSHAEVHSEYSFYCSECGKGFKSKTALRYHVIIHDPKKKLKCDKCSSTFQDKSKLSLHQKIVHEKSRDYQCDKCDRKFGLKANLRKHYRLTHLKLKTYQCENCGKRFGRRDYLKTHALHHCPSKEEIIDVVTIDAVNIDDGDEVRNNS